MIFFYKFTTQIYHFSTRNLANDARNLALSIKQENVESKEVVTTYSDRSFLYIFKLHFSALLARSPLSGTLPLPGKDRLKNLDSSCSESMFLVLIFGIMKIDLYQFNALTDPEKAQAVLEHGANLKTRKEDGFIINLYSLYNFYVEVWYDEGGNKIDRIRSFNSIDLLGPYIDDIDLEEV